MHTLGPFALPGYFLAQIPTSQAQKQAPPQLPSTSQPSPAHTSTQAISQALMQNPRKRPNEGQKPSQTTWTRFGDLWFLECEPPAKMPTTTPYWINMAKRAAENNKMKYANHDDILFMEEYMEEVKIPNVEKQSAHQVCFRIQRSLVFMRLQPSIFSSCLDVLLRRSLSIVKGDLNLSAFDVRFIHPQLPNGQKLFFNKTFSKENVKAMVNELVVAEKQNPKFHFDENLQVHIIIAKKRFVKYVLGETNTLLKAIAVILYNDLQKNDKVFSMNFVHLLRDEKHQEWAALFLLKTYDLMHVEFTLQSLPIIAQKMADYEFTVMTNNSRVYFNKGQAKKINLVEINGKFDAVI
ncbi:unnamed protein product [Caenorhabditis angaria]|uniref:Uncharacterized protein n=1 Tax=Caenorhabditis angaria TaxID=860376 RepID=A0A9P1NBC6_9PELO|nr:unnamed protein product [Caenorhabditis angaria]